MASPIPVATARRRFLFGAVSLVGGADLLAACASAGAGASPPAAAAGLDPAGALDRIAWGANSSDFERVRAMGTGAWIAEQLRPDEHAPMPPEIQAQIDAMKIERTPLPDLVIALEAQRKAADAVAEEEAKKAAHHDYQQELNRLAREAATRQLLRAVYSPKQLQEQMTWFWFNHFNVHQNKHLIRAMVGDYERQLRARSLGRFRDLLAASAYHPAMLAYLDNAQNGVGHINENYARELLELHTLGVDGGYTQRDVQELARALTGFGVNHGDPPRLRRETAGLYVRNGLFEFNPNRHDFGDKQVLGTTIHGHGAGELEDVLDLVARHPATARHVCRKLARFFVGGVPGAATDEPDAQLVEAMAQEFRRTDGRIDAVLAWLFASPAFSASLHQDFKDPVHYVVSAVRLSYDRKPILNANPMVNWLNRLGEAPYSRPTPDGFSLSESAWDAPGQMAIRFEIARAIGSGSAGLFRTDGPTPSERPAFPQLANAYFYESTQGRLASATRQSLEQANSPQEWNMLLLSSPEFMMR
jgi:uncharacterized protein (DUF1800 family)